MMIVEERIYKIRTGQMPRFLSFIEEQTLPIQQEVLGNLIAYFQTEIGMQNQVVHLWGYDDLEDRRARRARLASMPEWQALVPTLGELIETAENRILIPTRFSPIK